jgi:hypothetical protein
MATAASQRLSQVHKKQACAQHQLNTSLFVKNA